MFRFFFRQLFCLCERSLPTIRCTAQLSSLLCDLQSPASLPPRRARNASCASPEDSLPYHNTAATTSTHQTAAGIL